MNRIKVKFDKELKMISVYNNGKGIPIEIHKISNVYVPEMLFGQLMTSSNYNSRKKFRGIGAKITNLFSTQFTVETTDTTQKKRYIQTFRNNMTQTGNPEITDYNNKEEYTKVSFIPDLERFGMTELTDDAIALLSKRVYDMAGTVKDEDDIKFFINDNCIQTKDILNIEKLDDAVNAGTRHAPNCTLVLTEGDSAKALALSGFDIVGRDNWGVYPLKGKLLNVRNASQKQIEENKEVQELKQILGLQHDKQYNSINDLRYGKLMIMTDQDLDGSHIKGLIINFFDHFYPSLLKQPGFLQEFITPIVKCTKNDNTLSFFTLTEYEAWKRQNGDGKGWKIKYYKGLGTSTSDEAKEYFSDLNKHIKKFKPMDEEDHRLIDMAFAKKNAGERKIWIRDIQEGTYIDYNHNEITIKDFINKELSLFSLSDNVRSIPSVIDGLKPGQRKVLFGCIKKGLMKGQLKVSQLSGYVSEQSAYHHGEASLHSTIIGLAQDFVGSNNINLLEPIGQFGKRNDGGKSAASARYINTRLSPFARLIYHPDDDVLLFYLIEDGSKIEPKWYVPIIPMVLINGAEGIGTGWSTSIPNFNPIDIIQNLRRKIKGEDMIPMHPWYRGFYGEIKQVGTNNHKYISHGIIEKKSDTKVLITELPLHKWTDDYRSKVLNELRENGIIRNITKNNCTNERVDLEIELNPEKVKYVEKKGFEKVFQLTSSLVTSNMVCFNSNNKLTKYDSPEDILNEFYDIRLNLYVERRVRSYIIFFFFGIYMHIFLS